MTGGSDQVGFAPECHEKHLLGSQAKCEGGLKQRSANFFSIKVKIVNILSLEGHIWSLLHIPLCLSACLFYNPLKTKEAFLVLRAIQNRWQATCYLWAIVCRPCKTLSDMCDLENVPPVHCTSGSHCRMCSARM